MYLNTVTIDVNLLASMGLVVLIIGFMILVYVIKIFSVLSGKKSEVDAPVVIQAAPAPIAYQPPPAVAAAPPMARMIPAEGSQGEIKIFNVEPKTAAMIMAIVADEMKVPLNELKFNSIREK